MVVVCPPCSFFIAFSFHPSSYCLNHLKLWMSRNVHTKGHFNNCSIQLSPIMHVFGTLEEAGGPTHLQTWHRKASGDPTSRQRWHHHAAPISHKIDMDLCGFQYCQKNWGDISTSWWKKQIMVLAKVLFYYAIYNCNKNNTIFHSM